LDAIKGEIVTAVKMKMRAEIAYYDGGMIKGELFSRYLDAPYSFTSLIRMIGKMEEIFDSMKFPGAFLSPRTFGSARGQIKKSEVEKSTAMKEATTIVKKEAKSSKCTFEISVRYRQNATWQGQITWVERNLQQNFRSVLEMLKLMDEALTEGEDDAGTIVWEGDRGASS